MKHKNGVSLLTAVAISLSMLTPLSVSAAEITYSCDFSQLVKDGADTTYGTSKDIYQLDDCTSAYLTYEGTYVSSDAEVYLKSSSVTNASGSYSKGSYIAFTAPSDGSVTIKGKDIGVYIDTAYQGYGKSLTYEMTQGQTLYAGYRKGTTYVSELTFAGAPEATAVPTVNPDVTQIPTVDEPEREVIYSEDFEDYKIGTNGGWTSPAGTMSIKSDSESVIGKYQTVVSGKNGTCRSGYVEIPAVTENFVFECDFKSTSNVNVSDLELLESKSSVYANHGRYSNAKYAFTMARPKNADLYVINNASDDSGMKIDSYTAPVFTTAEIADNPWLHVKVVGNYATHSAIVYIMSLDRKKVYYHGKVDMSGDINSWKCIHLLSPSAGADTCIDNIKVSKALDEDLSEVFHTVTINDGISEFSQYVYDGETPVNIPDMSVYGSYFLGWDVNGVLYSGEKLTALGINEDTTITASISDDYIENIASVEFNSFPANSLLVMGTDGDTYADNEISLSITGERGTSIVSNADSRVKDYKIDWEFEGFRTMNGKFTGETGTSYCDSYGEILITEAAQTAVNFRLKNTSANYYGRVTATVTYNGKSIKVSSPLLLLADTSNDSSRILPAAGYCADYSNYDDALVGYTLTRNDILTGGWSMSGSDSTSIVLSKENNMKYLSAERALTGNSSYIYQNAGNITAQTVFAQDVRFGADVSIEYGTGKDTTAFTSTAFKAAFTNSSITLNGVKVCAASTDKWYHIEIAADPTSQLCYGKVYDYRADGDYRSETPIGQTDEIAFSDGYTSGMYYRFTLSKNREKFDFNNVTVTAPVIEETSVTITAPETIAMSENESVTAEFNLSAKTVDGNKAIGKAVWKIGDEFAEGVSIESNGDQSAVLTIAPTASAGELPINVTINGYTVTKKIKILGTKDNVTFEQALTGIEIPEKGSASYKFSACVIDGNAEKVNGRTVTYALYNEDGTDLKADGISVSEGIVTVTSSAAPKKMIVKASSVDSNGNEISKSVKVSVYGKKFVFGSTNADGYTQVSADDVYTENRGYGIVGAGFDNDGYISGNGVGFKVKAEVGNVYSVKVKYEGTIRCEYVNSELTGFERTVSFLGEDTYNVAVTGDGIMDITLSGEGKISSIEYSKVERTANAKPAWWTIGDSTVQQNGSWAYTIASSSTSDLSKYPKLAQTISTFHNSGRAGRQHRSYYSEGLFNNVLTNLRPGDVVSISGMGTNDSSSSKDTFKMYNNIYIDAIEDMGGYVILGSYTPSGNYGMTEGKVYDSDNILFKGMRTDAYDMAIREVYTERVSSGDDKVIGFIDIGKLSDNLMTNDVRIEYNNAAAAGKSVSEARAAAELKATEMMSWWKDYNHYYTTFSNYILPEITNRAARIISGEKQDELPKIMELSEIAPDITPQPTSTPLPDNNDTAGIEVVSSDEYIDVSSLVMYDNATYRIYSADGSYVSGVAENGKVHNTTGGEVTVVPEYKFEFTTLESSADSHINGYVKVRANSYSQTSGYGLLSGVDYNINANGCKPVSEAPIKVDMPKGYYDIEVYRLGGARADVYAQGSQIIQNTTSAGPQNREAGSALMYAPGMMIENGSVDITFGNISGSNERIASVSIVRVPEKYRKPLIWVAGDSESANYYAIDKYGSDLESEKIMITGFGTQLDKYLSDKYSVANFGQPSATAGTWNAESLEAVSKRMTAGDIVLICFGINDAVSSSNKVSEAEALANIQKIIDAAKKKDVKPILLSPIYNSKYQGKSYFTYNNKTNSLGEYAENAGVDFIDLNRFTMQYVNDAITETGDLSWIKNNYHVADNLHLTQHSAMLVASIICAGMEDLGYEMNDYAYTYSDISEVADGNVRGTETGVTRVYSVAEAHKLMENALATPKPESNVLAEYAAPSTTWTFNAAKPAESGYNVPVISGSASWDESNGNIKFDASTKTTGKVSINLDPKIKNDKITVEFDINIGQLGGQNFAYTITDTEDNKLIDCYFDSYNTAGKLSVAGTSIAEDGEFIKLISSTRGDGMSAAATHIKNVIDFDSNTVIVKIGSKEFSGILSGAETGDVSKVEIYSYRSKTADRHNHVDNIAISEEGTGAEETPIPDIEVNNINVLQSYIDDANVGVTIADGFKGTVIAALYSNDGRIKAVKSSKDNSKANTIMFDKPSEMTGYIKLMGWDMNEIKPYDDAITVKLSDISIPSSDMVESFAYSSYSDGENTMPYRYYLPINYNANEKYPVIVYLHAETRTGNDNKGQLYNAQYMFNKLLNEDNISRYKAILVAPQCGDNQTWSENTALVKCIVKELEKKFSVDTDRLYLAGYSMGANGCYTVAKENPGMFAAIMPAGGECDTVTAQQIAAENTAVMVFHGSEDESVGAEKARSIVSAMVDGGARNAEYHEFYGESHNVQESAANAEGIYEWLFDKNLISNSVSEEKTVDLAIFMGQSNMAGRGEYSDATVCPVGHGYEFRSVTAANMLCNVTGPFGKNENNDNVNDNSGQGVDRRSGDMVSSVMESYYRKTGTPIVAVQCSRGGTDTSYWLTSSVKTEAQSRLTAAKAYLEDNGYTIGKIFMVWCQGESDADKIYSGKRGTETYKSNTISVFEYMQAVGVTDMFIVQTGHYNAEDTDGKHDEAYVAVHDAQGELAQENEHIYTVGSLLEYKSDMKDAYHFHQRAYNEVGTAAGESIAAIFAEK